MAVVNKAGTPSLATLTPSPGQQRTLPAFADIAAGDMVYIKSDGTFDLLDGTANNAAAQWWGMAVRSAKAGQPVTAVHGVEFRYGSGLTPGARLYAATTPGALDTATTTGGDVPCAFATGPNTVFVMAPGK